MTDSDLVNKPVSQLSYKGVTWKYCTRGTGPLTVVMFPGIIGGLEMLDSHIQAFSKEHKVLAVAIPPLSSVETFCEGLQHILELEHTRRMILLGASFGGFLAQAYFFRHPRQVERMILSDTDIPNRHRGNINWLIRLGIKWAPFFITRPLFTAKFNNLFNHPVPAEKAHLVEDSREKVKVWMKHHFTKEMFLSRMNLSIDYDAKERLLFDKLDNWQGKVLVTGSDDDPMWGETEPIQDIYPQAQYHCFKGGGHLSQLLQFNDYVRIAGHFIKTGELP